MPKPGTKLLTGDGKSRKEQNYRGKLHFIFLLMFSAMITVKFDSVLMVVWIMSFDFTGTSVYFYEHSKTPRPKSLTQSDPTKKSMIQSSDDGMSSRCPGVVMVCWKWVYFGIDEIV